MSGGARSLATRVLVGRRDDVILVYARSNFTAQIVTDTHLTICGERS